MANYNRSSRTVLVTGANGFLGNAVARAFSLAGWKTYGLVRRETAAPGLWKDETTPVIGSSADHCFIDTLPIIDVVVSTTEDWSDYVKHFNDNIEMFTNVADRAKNEGSPLKPLVIFTSGCKDYGMTRRHGDPELRPHTEESPLNGPKFLWARTEHSKTIFNHKDIFDAVLMRPTTFHGRSGTYYGPLFTLAEQSMSASGGDGTMKLPADPDSIMHGTHIDDVANAYLAVAEASRESVAGEIFNVSSRQYETAAEVAGAVAESYGIRAQFTGSKPFNDSGVDWAQVLMDFTQWVDSKKIRRVTGWTDKKPLFTEDLERYRRTFEAYVSEDHENVQKIRERAARRKAENKE